MLLALLSLSQQMFVICSIIIAHTERAFIFESLCLPALVPILECMCLHMQNILVAHFQLLDKKKKKKIWFMGLFHCYTRI